MPSNENGKRCCILMNFVVALIGAYCLSTSCPMAAENNIRKEARQNTPKSQMIHWHSAGGEWHDSDHGLLGVVDGSTRGFAVADDMPFAGAQTLEVVVTPLQHVGDSWSAGRLCLYERAGSYWRLVLVESPDKSKHYAEMTLMNEGTGLGESAFRPLEPTEPPFDWKWNTAYRLRITVAPDRIMGEVFSADGIRRWHAVYALTGTAFVRSGWPAAGVQGNGLGALRLPSGFQSTYLPNGVPQWQGSIPAMSRLALEPVSSGAAVPAH